MLLSYFHVSAFLNKLYKELRIVYRFFSQCLSVPIVGQLARQVYETMRREASCLRIQRDLRMYFARKAYKDMCTSAVSIQTGMRGMAARNELRFRRQTRAAIIIQVSLSFFFPPFFWVVGESKIHS